MVVKHDCTLAIDLGGTKILAAVIGPDNQVLSRAKKKTRGGKAIPTGAAGLVERITSTANAAIEEAGIARTRLACAGLGTPGPIDWRTGIVTEAPNLGLKNFNIKQALEGALKLPTFAFNDVNVGAWGEYVLGAGRGCDSCLAVFVGTGIGGGLILNGQLYEGAGRFAGEIGHMRIDLKGPLCGCGHKGCLEALASRTAITRDLWAAMAKGQKSVLATLVKKKGGQIRSSELRKALEQGDKVVARVLGRAAEHLGVGLGGAANLLNPECIVLGGGVVTALGESFLGQVREGLRGNCFKSVFESTRLVAATLGDDAGILGAALLAREKLAALGAGKK